MHKNQNLVPIVQAAVVVGFAIRNHVKISRARKQADALRQAHTESVIKSIRRQTEGLKDMNVRMQDGTYRPSNFQSLLDDIEFNRIVSRIQD